MKEEIKSKWPLTIQALFAVKKDGKPKGQITCPKCQGILRYTIASNGHTRGRCTTENCLSWIE